MVAEAQAQVQDLSYSIDLLEANVQITDKKKKKIKLRLIKSGRSQRGNYYAPDVLQEAAPLFESVKMYIDHPAKEVAGQPRSFRDWAATILEAKYVPEDEAIDATVGIRSKWLWEVIQEGKEEGWLDEIGASINAAGPTHPGQMNNKKTNIVEGIQIIRSVDFVPEASAGGHIQQVLESKLHVQEEETMEQQVITVQTLLDEHPQLVEAIQDATLNAALTDIDFVGGLVESAFQGDNEDLMTAILEGVANDEGAMTVMIEGIEQARVDEFGYGFDALEEAVTETTTALEEANTALTALSESAGSDGGVDLAQFENAVRQDEAKYWHDHYGPAATAMQEGAVSGLTEEEAKHVTQLTEQVNHLTEENDQLRGDFASVISKATAMGILQESGLPQASADRLLPLMKNLTESEMHQLVDDKKAEIAAIVGKTRVAGMGSAKPTPTELKESAQGRMDDLFGYTELEEAAKQPVVAPKTDLSHLG